MSPLRYAQLITLGGLLALIGFFYLESQHYQHELDSLKAGQAAYLKIHLGQLAAAKVKRDKETKDNDQYRAKHPMGAIFLCKSSPGQASRPTSTGTSPSGGMGQPVPPGDTLLRIERAGPDVGPLQDALGALCDKVTADLREQQAVQ